MIENEFFLYALGGVISLIHFIIILILFTEPNKDDEANMLTQQIHNISQVTDDFEEEISKKKNEKTEEKYEVSGSLKSINDQSRNNSDDLTFQENNKIIKIDNKE